MHWVVDRTIAPCASRREGNDLPTDRVQQSDRPLTAARPPAQPISRTPSDPRRHRATSPRALVVPTHPPRTIPVIHAVANTSAARPPTRPSLHAASNPPDPPREPRCLRLPRPAALSSLPRSAASTPGSPRAIQRQPSTRHVPWSVLLPSAISGSTNHLTRSRSWESALTSATTLFERTAPALTNRARARRERTPQKRPMGSSWFSGF
jgi:hypothetical protein